MFCRDTLNDEKASPHLASPTRGEELAAPLEGEGESGNVIFDVACVHSSPIYHLC
jgi:hypothetical protein